MEEKQYKFTIIYCDNKPIMIMENNSFHYKKTNHIFIKYHFIKGYNQTSKFNSNTIDTKNQIENILTEYHPKS